MLKSLLEKVVKISWNLLEFWFWICVTNLLIPHLVYQYQLDLDKNECKRPPKFEAFRYTVKLLTGIITQKILMPWIACQILWIILKVAKRPSRKPFLNVSHKLIGLINHYLNIKKILFRSILAIKRSKTQRYIMLYFVTLT